MFRRSDIQRTPKELAERAIMRTFARLGACGLLIYFVVKFLMQTRSEEPGTSAPVIIAVVFVVLAAVVIVFTIIDLISSFKSGAFKASTYGEADTETDENDSTDESDGHNDAAASEDADEDGKD
jgi:hypothetical protein